MFIRKCLIVLAIFTEFDACKLSHVTTWSRKEYLQKSKVWHKTDIPRMNILAGPQNEISFRPEEEVSCQYVEPKESAKGFSPKFKCKIKGSHEVRVKYKSRETLSEIAATRLLWALGFYTDEVYPVKLKCLNCPSKNPSQPSDSEPRVQLIFGDAIIERNFPGKEIGEYKDQGWTWKELDVVDAKHGGSSRAEIDALKLLAVFLQHTDNKRQQQRLACYSQDLDQSSLREVCKKPVLMIQDLGATFGMGGPKVEAFSSMYFRGWDGQHIWNQTKEETYFQKNGRKVCIGNLAPSEGGDLFDPEISEEGRRFLSDLLNQLTDQQIQDLFRVSRVERTNEMLLNEGRQIPVTIEDWTLAFKKKRQEINDRHC